MARSLAGASDLRAARNPYRWDVVDATLFYGREVLAATLLERLLAGERFAVAGGRRMGKTTLLRRLESDLLEHGSTGGMIVLPVFVDMAELYAGAAEDAYGVIGRRMLERARETGLPDDDPGLASEPELHDVTSGPDLAELLRALLQATRRRGRLQFVFLFDEIERVLRATWGGGFLAYWRMLLNNMGELSRCLSAVFCGAAGIYQIAQDAGSPLGNILAWQELEPLDLAATARLVREPSCYDWPDALVERVYDATGGHPCLTQFLMQRVCEREVEAGEAALAGAERRFLREHATMFANWWQSFEEPARAIYTRLAADSPAPEGELIAGAGGRGKRALDVLAHTGVVRWDQEARTVAAAGTLFLTWARESVPRESPPPPALTPRPRLPQAGEGESLPPSSRAAGEGPVGSGGWGLSPLGLGRRIATVLFTDIVNSTRLTAELGDRRWLEVVSAHNTRVREVLAAFRGHEVKTTGDGFLALFEAPAAAIQCACAIASAVRPLGLEVRAGLHAGEFEDVGNDVIGIAINYAAWVMSRARGGEVVVSETVRGLVAGSGIRFVNRGTHRVKGSRERHRLYAVDSAADERQPSLPCGM